MQPVRERPNITAPEPKKKRGEFKVIVEFNLFQKTVEQIKKVEDLDNLVVRWPSNKLVAIRTPANFYYSTCFSHTKGTHNFVYFYDGDTIDEKKVLLAVRSHPAGKSGEIIHLKKSEAMSGTESLLLGIKLLKALKIKRIFTNDASYFKFAGVNLLMRVYLPITSQDGKSFYGKHKFVPMACSNLVGAANLEAETAEERKAPIYNQDPNFYYESIRHIRNTSLSTFVHEILTVQAEKEKVLEMATKYVSATIHTLAKSVLESKNEEEFVRFYEIALSPAKPGSRASQVQVKYHIALDCLYSTRIFELEAAVPAVAVPDFNEITDALPKKIVSYDSIYS